MAYTEVNYRSVEAAGGARHSLREPRGTDQLGMTVIDCEPGWTGRANDHADDHEWVYLLLEGEATITIDGRESVPMDPSTTPRLAGRDQTDPQRRRGAYDVVAGAP